MKNPTAFSLFKETGTTNQGLYTEGMEEQDGETEGRPEQSGLEKPLPADDAYRRLCWVGRKPCFRATLKTRSGKASRTAARPHPAPPGPLNCPMRGKEIRGSEPVRLGNSMHLGLPGLVMALLGRMLLGELECGLHGAKGIDAVPEFGL